MIGLIGIAIPSTLLTVITGLLATTTVAAIDRNIPATANVAINGKIANDEILNAINVDKTVVGNLDIQSAITSLSDLIRAIGTPNKNGLFEEFEHFANVDNIIDIAATKNAIIDEVVRAVKAKAMTAYTVEAEAAYTQGLAETTSENVAVSTNLPEAINKSVKRHNINLEQIVAAAKTAARKEGGIFNHAVFATEFKKGFCEEAWKGYEAMLRSPTDFDFKSQIKLHTDTIPVQGTNKTIIRLTHKGKTALDQLTNVADGLSVFSGNSTKVNSALTNAKNVEDNLKAAIGKQSTMLINHKGDDVSLAIGPSPAVGSVMKFINAIRARIGNYATLTVFGVVTYAVFFSLVSIFASYAAAESTALTSSNEVQSVPEIKETTPVVQTKTTTTRRRRIVTGIGVTLVSSIIVLLALAYFEVFNFVQYVRSFFAQA